MCPLGYIRQSKAATVCIFHDYEFFEKFKFHDAHKNLHFCGPIIPIHNTCPILNQTICISLFTYDKAPERNNQGVTVIGTREHSL